MNPFDILGKQFSSVESDLDHLGIEALYDDLQPGQEDEQEFSVEAKDGSWEISLGNNQIIETIFLYKLDFFSDHLAFSSSSLPAEITTIFGQPTSSGRQSNTGPLGEQGAWQRYDTEDYALHIEQYIDSKNIKMVTIMLPEVAP